MQSEQFALNGAADCQHSLLFIITGARCISLLTVSDLSKSGLKTDSELLHTMYNETIYLFSFSDTHYQVFYD